MKKIANNEYIHNVPVSVSGGPDNIDIELDRSSVPIRFVIDMEARLWGIKGITLVVLDDIIQIPITVIHWGVNTGQDNEETRVITVDLRKVKQSRIQTTGIITLGDLEIYLNPDYSVNYKSSYLEVMS